jgi:Large polyvalent protein-associated domain 7
LQTEIEKARPFAEGAHYDAPKTRTLPGALQGFTAELNAGEVRYSQIDEKTEKPVVAFIDTGKTVTIHNWKNEDAVRAALHVASEKWGSLTLTGTTAFKAQAVHVAAENGYAITNPELQEQIAAARARIESQGERETRGQTTAPFAPVQDEAPLKSPTESALALEQNRLAIEREAVRETRQANAASRQGEVNPAQSSAETPYRPDAEAASARDAARAVDQSPNQSIPVEPTQSQTVRNLGADREQELNAQRYAEIAQRHAREEAQKNQSQGRERTHERDDGPER